MKPLTVLRKSIQRQLDKLPHSELLLGTATSLGVLTALSAIIWWYGPMLSINGITPFAQTDKRFYAITFCFLIWLLKFSLYDLDIPNTWQHKNPKIRNHLDHLVKRFHGAMRFMGKTTINSHGNSVQLQELPWYLLIGPEKAGKTAMLAHSTVPFILQRQFSPELPEHFDPSDNCDWWVTRDSTIVDVPSSYLFYDSKDGLHLLVWKYFLNLIKKQSAQKTINGLVIALPLAEIAHTHTTKQYNQMIDKLMLRIQDIQQTFNKSLPVYIIVTKCDLLPGFREFFSEASDDEITQAWGIQMPEPKPAEKIEAIFVARFNALIKKLNQQLLWRLHQERNPLARPLIKDFPLQIEKIKEVTLEFIKRARLQKYNCNLAGIYLTSALQTREGPETTASVNKIDTNEHAVTLFTPPTIKSRAFFIKQFVTNALHGRQELTVRIPSSSKWQRAFAYAASVLAIIGTGYFLGKDFQTGVRQTYQIKSNIANYQQVIREFHNPDKSMLKTLTLLDTLQKSIKPVDSKLSVNTLMNFYSNKSQQNAATVYHHALQVFLLPEVRNYLGDYLNDPVNKNADSIYSVLRAYLMLGSSENLDVDYVRNVILAILPKSFEQTKTLLQHFDIAVQSDKFKPLQLDSRLISNTRQYLNALPNKRLGFIILKSMNDNNKDSEISFDTGKQGDAIFSNSNKVNYVPEMYTGKHFNSVLEGQIRVAASEAINGNWILGTNNANNVSAETINQLSDELRAMYVSEYAQVWEKMIANIHIMSPKDLEQADAMIVSLISYDSPLLQVLHVLYENTFFEPVTKYSGTLLTLGELINKNTTSKNQLYQILSDLQELHEYLQPVISAENPQEAAYKLITDRMKHQGDPDPITKLRLAAEKSPEPLKNWLNQLTNDTWHFLLKNSMRYLDTSWNERVVRPYELAIANRYPFSNEATDEVAIRKFIRFFGRPGVITSFYDQYLDTFIDKSKQVWSWKAIGNDKLPFSKTVLRQIQHAMKIHKAFFPNDDDQLYVPFALQKQMLGKNIKNVTLNINDKIIEDNGTTSTPHVLKWPHKLNANHTSIQLTLDDDKKITNDFPGSWGWFRLVSQSFESLKSNKEIVVNFSKDNNAAKYVLSTKSKVNPFVALNLTHFKLADQLTTV